MSYTVQNLKTDMEASLHGTSLNKIQNVNGIIERAARELLGEADLNGTIRSQILTNPIYSKVYDYVLPSDLKGKKIIDIRPQVNRGVNDNFRQRSMADFDMRKEDNTLAIFFDSGVKTLRASKNTGKSATLSSLNSTTGWSVGGDATDLEGDDLYYISGGSSLKFNLSGASTYGYIQNSSLSSVDLSDYDEQGALFTWVYFPDSSIITSVNLRWGNDVSNYWDRTVTTNAEGNSFVNGWNLLKFDWDGATETGTLDNTAVDYARVTVNYNGTAEENIRVDNIVARLGSIFEIDYYSNALFQGATTSTWSENISDDSDIINVEVNETNLIIHKAVELAAEQVAGSDSGYDVNYYRSIFNRALKEYLADNQSQAIRPQKQYYRL